MAAMDDTVNTSINLDRPRYDQNAYIGRAKHFFIITNPLNLFARNEKLEQSKKIVEDYRKGVVSQSLSENELWRAKHLYDSAYHPDTKEKMITVGRMSAQVPMNMTVIGFMMTFYKSTPAVVFWQWINQSMTAVLNYTNRSGDSHISNKQLGSCYVAATIGATATGLGLNRMVKSMPPLIGRFVPFAAVTAANGINIPMMRSRELRSGIPVFSEDDTRIGDSRRVAMKAIPQVILTRVGMIFPCMILPPIVMQWLEGGKFLKKYPWMNAPVQVMLVGGCLTFALPMCLAMFPQRSSISVNYLEPELQLKLQELSKDDTHVYYNKGL